MSIRLRLTVLYSSILALTLIVFSSALYVSQARSSMNIIEQDLTESAEKLVLAWTRFHLSWDGRVGTDRPAPWDSGYRDEAQRVLQPLIREETRLDAVHILDAEGDAFPLPMNEDSEPLPISSQGLEKIQKGAPLMEVAQGEDARWLVYNLPVVAGSPTGEENVVGIVQLARPLADRDRSLRALGITLVLGSLSTTLIAFGIGWLLAGTTLRPIQRITKTAQDIGEARDFSSRVAYEGPKDELGRLAMTFNGMLARLEDAYRQVAHALQVQRDFVADVSHELRTPLTTIRGNLALLRRNPPLPSEEQVEILEDLTEESERLTRLVTDLLTLARADAGRELDLGPVHVDEVIEDVCRQAQVLAPARPIRCDEQDKITATANADALKQVLLILVDNAVKHAEGPIQLRLDEDDDCVNISIQDSGPGIPPDLQDRLFDRFHRGDVSRSTPGFGLGLSIAHALTKAQQGTLQVESEPGKGSTFTVRLPASNQSSEKPQKVDGRPASDPSTGFTRFS
ncbi:MAG: sensor histidine kinase [Anaerolineae bacterium]